MIKNKIVMEKQAAGRILIWLIDDSFYYLKE